MNRSHWFGLFVLLVSVVALPGCQQRPAVPTIAFEPTDPVVVIVVTATSQPTIMPTVTSVASAATITPIQVLTSVITVTATTTTTTTTAPTRAPQATRPPATVGVQDQPTPEPTAEVPPTVPVPTNFAAPAAFLPEGTSFRDGDTVKFEFASVGPLAADQCYRVDMTLGNPTGPGGVGDYWVGLCGNQSNAGDRLIFQVKPGRFRDEANYGTLLISADEVIPPTPEYVMRWFVTVVQMTDATDPIHPTVQPLSPASISLQNTFFR